MLGTTGDYAGYDLAIVPDATSDGVDELAVGAPGYDSYRGAAYVLYDAIRYRRMFSAGGIGLPLLAFLGGMVLGLGSLQAQTPAVDQVFRHAVGLAFP